MRQFILAVVVACALCGPAGAATLDVCANKTISSISVANPTVVTTSAPHNLVTGQTLTISGTNSTPNINGAKVVTVTGASTFTVAVNVTVSGNAGTAACTYQNFQTAITAAVSGDTIALQQNETFTGNFTFPNKSNASVITITSQADPANLPSSSTRITPAYSNFLAKLQASAGGGPAIQIQAQATKYTFQNLELLNNPGAYYTVVAVGFGDQTQILASQEPNNIIFDRIYAHGDPVAGQKNFFAFNGNTQTLKNSYVSNVHAIGQDSQCLAGFNGSGGWTVTNNYLECSTENIIIGGADPWERVYTTVTGATTTTSAVVTTVETGHLLNELVSGQLVAVETNNTTTPPTVEFVTLTGTGPAATSGTLSWTPAVSVAPSSGFRIRGGVVAKNITITGNHITKRLFWLTDGVLTKPINVTATPNTASGALAAGSHWYRIQAFSTHGYNNGTVWSTVSAEARCDLTATGKCDLAWPDSTGEDGYRVWSFSATGATSGLYIDLAANTTSYSDTGALTLTGAYLAGTRVQEKNLFEIKAAQSVTISGNVIEYSWKGSDIGYTGMWLKSVNQDGQCWWCQSRDITIEKNIFRHIDAWFLVSGREAGGTGNVRPPAVTNLTIQNNLVYDSNSSWSEGTSTPFAMKISDGTVNTVINHNTVICTGCSGAMYIYGAVSGRGHPGMVWQNNMIRRETYGVLDGDGTVGEGKVTMDLQAPGYTFTKNAMADANCGIYPTGNFCEASSLWQAEFNSYSVDGTNADYTLKPTSAYHNAATDGLDIGANIAQVLTTTTGVVQGVSTSPPQITTTSLPNGIRNTVYTSTTVTATGGTTPYTWAVQAGSTLPTGLAFSSGGVLSGTPTAAAGSYTFTLQVTDNGSQVVTQSYTIQLADGMSVTTTAPLTTAEKDVAYTATLAATGDAAPYTWSCPGCVLPTGLTLSSAGVLAGTPTANGTFNFNVQAAGSLGTTTTKALSMTVASETLPCNRNRAYNSTEAFIFRRRTAPTSSDCVVRGDIWLDTSSSDLKAYKATSVTPSVSWTSFTVASLTGDGSAITNLNASELKGGTIPASAFPNVFPGTIAVGTSIAAPVVQGDYLAMNQTACATPSVAGSGRLCIDANGNLKWSVNGAPYQSVSSAAGALIQNGNAFGGPIRIGSTDTQPVTFVSNGLDRGTLWSSGNWYLDPDNAAGMKFQLEIDRTTDLYSQGFSTANGRKGYWQSLQGTLQQVIGFADATSSTDTIFAISTSSNSGGAWSHWFKVRHDGLLTIGSKITSYNGTATAGGGMPIVVADARSTAQTGAVASVAAFTVGAADGTFEVSGNVLVTTATNHTFTVTCAYTDEGNTARTLTMPFTLLAGSAIVNSVANANGAVPYMGMVQTIRAKAGTTITIATTGTFTTVTYNVEGIIKQIS